MAAGKFFTLLDKLTPEEFANFLDFVASPYYNKRKELVILLQLIASQSKENGQINRENLYKSLFPKEDFNARKMSDLIYYLNLLLEDFIVTEKQRNDVFGRKLVFLAEANEKKVENIALGTVKELNALLDPATFRDDNYYYSNFLFFKELDKFFALSETRKFDKSLQDKSDNLDVFFLATKLRDACEMLNREHIIQSTYKNPMLEALLVYMAKNPDLYDAPPIKVYLNVLYMLRNPTDKSHFYKVLDILHANGRFFETEELRDLYKLAQNHCIRLVNSGDIGFLQDLLSIYKTMLENKVIFIGKHLLHWDYKNIVSTGLRLKEYEWTLSFIQQYRYFLKEEEKDNAYAYNLANYYYETSNYKNAVKVLRDVEFTDLYYNLDSKTMLLKIYYDTREDESFLSLIASFGTYLGRNKLITETNFVLYSNLLKYTKKLFNLRAKLPYKRDRNFTERLAALTKDVNEEPNIANIKWLKNRVNALA